MGCFNVCCSVSNISIGWQDKVVLLPLANKGYYKEGKGFEYDKMPMADSSLIYPHCYFEPVSLPIVGEYNDYGTLENIIKDANTRAIEDYFEVSIEAFMEGITSFRQYEDPLVITDKTTKFEKLLPRLTGMFIYKPIYDHLKSSGIPDWIFSRRSESYAEEYDEYVVKQRKALETKESIAELRDMLEVGDGNMVARAEALEALVNDTAVRDIMNAHTNKFLDYHRDWFRFGEIMAPTVAKGLLKADLCYFKNFYNHMYSANRFLFPAMNGEQHGNLDASLLLARETVRLLEAKKKKHMEDCGEDYEK